MTKNRELDLQDLTECDHKPEIPICDEDGMEILYWVCRCGKEKHYPQEGEVHGD